MIDDVIAHLRKLGVERVYLSNDIDATDARRRAVDGRARERAGCRPPFVRALIARVGAAFPLLGADVVEVAPPDRVARRCPAHGGGGGLVHARLAGRAGRRAESALRL